ncbi:beta-lactamase family protein [Candidatus Kaiserbacteria bacterium]|nr:beta-lactamase family protein [Candidatus Kaiserbacteria bacterium]
MPEAEIKRRVDQAIAEKVFPGCVVGVVSDHKTEILSFGHLTYDAGSEVVREDTTYDLASITKSIPLASLAAILIRAGKLSLTDRVRKYLPELQNDYDATIEDLLHYHVRGPQLSKLHLKTFEEIRTHVFEHGFDGKAGERAYSNLPAFLLGIILERVSGESLAALSHRLLFGPLGMEQTTFFPVASNCAPTEIDDRGEVRGLPHDESTYVFAKVRRAVGHAGLFSTAGDLLKFLSWLLETESIYGHGVSIYQAAEQGLGWEIGATWMGSGATDKTFGKTGFTGTSVCVDRAKGKAFAILSNRTYPKRPADNTAINAFRRDIADIVLA